MLLARLLVPACLHLLACFYQDDIDGDNNNNKIIRPINKKYKAQTLRSLSLKTKTMPFKKQLSPRPISKCMQVYICMYVYMYDTH